MISVRHLFCLSLREAFELKTTAPIIYGDTETLIHTSNFYSNVVRIFAHIEEPRRSILYLIVLFK